MAEPRPEFKVVRPRLTKDEVIVEIRSGVKPSVADLMARSGMSRGTIRGLVNQWSPTDQIRIPRPRRPKEMVNQPAEPESKFSRCLRAVLLRVPAALIVIPALSMGGVGMWWNFQYWYAFGGLAFGILGGSIDSVTVFLPFYLRRRWSHIPLFGLWLVCSALSGIAELGSTANSIGDGLQGRAATVQRRGRLEAELATAKMERWKITEDRNPAAIEQQIQIAQAYVPQPDWRRSNHCESVTTSVSCLDLVRLREAKANATLRIELDKKIHDLSEKMDDLPAIASKDAAADHIAWITWDYVKPSAVENIRVIGFAFMPSLAGFLLAFARTR